MKITKRQLRRIINEEYRRILNEVEFHDSKDEDRPGKKQTVVFDEDETYEEAGDTHGKESHAIKHYGEFEPEEFRAALDSAINVAKDAEDVHIINPAGDVVQSGDDAKKSMNHNAILNTLDLVNDKQKNDEALNDDEEKLTPILQDLTDSYDELVQSYLDDAEDIDEVEDADEIKAKIDSGTILKFTGDFKGTLATYYLDPSNAGLVAEIDGKVATLFRIDKRGGSLSKIAGYFARGVELTNSALTTALSSDEEEAEEQPQEQKKEKKQKKQQSASTPEEFVQQLKDRGLPDQALRGALTGWMRKNAPDRVEEIDELLAAGRKMNGSVITERWQKLAGIIK